MEGQGTAIATRILNQYYSDKSATLLQNAAEISVLGLQEAITGTNPAHIERKR
jgi:hypothetical protein